jgi:hypothetical protein
MPVPLAPPPGATLQKPGRVRDSKAASAAKAADAAKSTEADKAAADSRTEPTPRSTGTNDLLAFLTFVEHHKPGSSVNAIVENYSSHGAYVRIGDVKGYVPLSLMADPAPRSAREFMKIGESITLVVESFAPSRRSIDLAIPTMTTVRLSPPEGAAEAKPKRISKKSAAKAPSVPEAFEIVPVEAPVATPPPRKRASKKAAAPEPEQVTRKPRAKKAAATKPPIVEAVAAPAQTTSETGEQPARKRPPRRPVAALAASSTPPEPVAPGKPTRRRAKSA